MDTDELTRFGQYVETLEIAVGHLREDSAARTRQALIGLDNLAEVLMHAICESLFEHDEFIAKLVPPRFTPKKKGSVRWGFPEKVHLLQDELVIDPERSELLSILHHYRTPAFHRFDHNPRSARVVAICSLPAVLGLLEHVYRGIMVGGLQAVPEWVTRYSLRPSPIDFAAASREIGRQLMDGLRPDPVRLRQALVEDIETRCADVRRTVREELFDPSPAALDEMLREEEFWLQFDDDEAARNYRQLVYAITQRQESVDPEEFRRLEDAYRQRVTNALRDFPGTLTGGGLTQVENEAAGIAGASSDAAALGLYSGLDERLRRYEEAIGSAARKMDQMIQAEVDRRRGK